MGRRITIGLEYKFKRNPGLMTLTARQLFYELGYDKEYKDHEFNHFAIRKKYVIKNKFECPFCRESISSFHNYCSNCGEDIDIGKFNSENELAEFLDKPLEDIEDNIKYTPYLFFWDNNYQESRELIEKLKQK